MEKLMKQKSLEERKKEFLKLKASFPNKIPIILDKNPNFPNLKDTTKNKFLLAEEFTVKQFFNILIKSYLQLDTVKDNLNLEIKLYSTSNNIEIQTNEEELLLNIYNIYKDEDGFLYLKYSYLYTKKDNIKEKENEGTKIIKAFPLKVPIILKKDPNYTNIEEISKSKFLIDKAFKVYDFTSYLEKNYLKKDNYKFYLTTDKGQKLFNYEILSDIYNDYKNKNDGFLYLFYYYIFEPPIKEYNLKSVDPKEKEKEFELLMDQNDGMMPIILEKDSNYPDNKEISNKNFLIKMTLKVEELLKLINQNYLNLSPVINGKYLNLVLTISPYHINLSNDDTFFLIFDDYRNKDGFLCLNYSYEYIQSNYLPFFCPKYKYNNNLKKGKETINDIIPNDKIPVYIEKYPLSNLIDINENKYYLLPSNKIIDVKNLIKKGFEKNKTDNINFNLITENNIDITIEDETSIKDIYDKYKNEKDRYLYLFYLESSLLTEKKFKTKEKFNFKEKYNLEERKKIYENLKNKNKNKILIRVENEYINNEKEKNDEILFFEPNNEFDSLKIKIWKKNGKPFLNVILKDENKKIIDSYEKIIDLYNKYKDKEDEFLYLFYTLEKTDFNIMENEIKNMSEGHKIFLLFNRIPFVFRPSPNYANSNTQKVVYLKYDTRFFNLLQTDQKYKYYIEYPGKEIDEEEYILFFYLDHRNKDNGFLYLIIKKDNNLEF